MIVAGMDEAGRGPLIGSMFVALVVAESSQLEKLVTLGLKDSKVLSPNKRKYFYNLILKTSKLVLVKEVKVEEIDRESVSELTIRAMAELLRKALEEVEIDEVCVDIVGNGKKQEEELKKIFPNVKVLKKAEAKCPAVAAASVVAKEMRERHLSRLKAVYGDFGSGYPSDPKTLSWLERVESLPPIVRKKWKTVKSKGARAAARGEGENDNSLEARGGGN